MLKSKRLRLLVRANGNTPTDLRYISGDTDLAIFFLSHPLHPVVFHLHIISLLDFSLHTHMQASTIFHHVNRTKHFELFQNIEKSVFLMLLCKELKGKKKKHVKKFEIKLKIILAHQVLSSNTI